MCSNMVWVTLWHADRQDIKCEMFLFKTDVLFSGLREETSSQSHRGGPWDWPSHPFITAHSWYNYNNHYMAWHLIILKKSIHTKTFLIVEPITAKCESSICFAAYLRWPDYPHSVSNDPSAMQCITTIQTVHLHIDTFPKTHLHSISPILNVNVCSSVNLHLERTCSAVSDWMWKGADYSVIARLLSHRVELFHFLLLKCKAGWVFCQPLLWNATLRISLYVKV